MVPLVVIICAQKKNETHLKTQTKREVYAAVIMLMV